MNVCHVLILLSIIFWVFLSPVPQNQLLASHHMRHYVHNVTFGENNLTAREMSCMFIRFPYRTRFVFKCMVHELFSRRAESTINNKRITMNYSSWGVGQCLKPLQLLGKVPKICCYLFFNIING